MLNRRIRTFTLVVLGLAAFASLHAVHEFGQSRFFTIDEYQFGHATWLIGQGQIPYADFYEHHFPLSYVLHAPLFSGAARGVTFGELALRLRLIVFAYILLACVLAGLATREVTKDPYEALLAGFLPATLGFGLMSAVDYRADSIGAFVFLASLFLLELNRERRAWPLAGLAGGLAMVSALMTQKMALLGGATIMALYAADGLQLLLRRTGRTGKAKHSAGLFISKPVAFAGTSVLILVIALGCAAALGILRDGYVITILQALEHEAHYPAVPVRLYLDPFVAATWFSTVPIVLFAGFYLMHRSSGLWRIAIVAALVFGAVVKAQYPYNYVYISYLIAFCSLRGFGILVRRLSTRLDSKSFAWPLVYLIPLAVLPDQLGFVAHATTNAHQLALLDKIQAYTTERDVVIDNSGGALFRDHGSYYYQHGAFHREIFRDYFENDLVQDYLHSQAIFWIEDMRSINLPASVQSYLRGHYIRVYRDLHALGFVFPSNRDKSHVFEIDVIRAGHYHLFSTLGGKQGWEERLELPTEILIDGKRVRGGGLHLEPGRHQVSLSRGLPSVVLSILPPDAFELGAPTTGRGDLRHGMLFEFDSAS